MPIFDEKSLIGLMEYTDTDLIFMNSIRIAFQSGQRKTPQTAATSVRTRSKFLNGYKGFRVFQDSRDSKDTRSEHVPMPHKIRFGCVYRGNVGKVLSLLSALSVTAGQSMFFVRQLCCPVLSGAVCGICSDMRSASVDRSDMETKWANRTYWT